MKDKEERYLNVEATLTIKVKFKVLDSESVEDAVDNLAYDIYDGVGGDVVHNTDLVSTKIEAVEKEE